MNQTTQASSGGERLLELTSVRAFAAFIVVLFHMYQPNAASDPGVLGRIILDGHLGVDFFFILSGFILTHVYLQRWRDGTFQYKSFLWARLARIYPLHVFMLLVFLIAYSLAVLAGLGDLEGMRWSHLPWHALLLHSWGFTDAHSWNFPSWSVSAEAFAYLAFPAILFMLPIRRPWLTLVVSTAALCSAWFVLQGWGWTLTKLMYDFGIVRIAFEFLLGVSLYLVFERARIGPKLASLIATVSFLGVLLVATMEGPEIVSVLLFALIILALGVRSRSAAPSILRHRLLVYLGEISYSTYMVHLLVLMVGRKIFEKVGPHLDLGATFEVITIVVVIYLASMALYHWIEMPARSFLRGRGPKRNADSMPAGHPAGVLRSPLARDQDGFH